MAKIYKSFNWGGSNQSPSGAGEPTLADVLRDIADDLGARSGITTADGVHAAGASPTAAEYDALVDLVNEIKTAMNTTVKTTKG